MALSNTDLRGPTASDARARLLRLQLERFEALQAGVDPDSSYMAHLGRAIRDARAGCVTAAVTEIAALRGDLRGLQVG